MADVILPRLHAGIHPTLADISLYRRNVRVVVTVIEDEPARLSPWKADGGAFSATMGALKVTVYSDRGSSWFWDVKAPDGTTIAASWEPSLTSARNNAVQAASEALA